jgi:hypothetical protein
MQQYHLTKEGAMPSPSSPKRNSSGDDDDNNSIYQWENISFSYMMSYIKLTNMIWFYQVGVIDQCKW